MFTFIRNCKPFSKVVVALRVAWLLPRVLVYTPSTLGIVGLLTSAVLTGMSGTSLGS